MYKLTRLHKIAYITILHFGIVAVAFYLVGAIFAKAEPSSTILHVPNDYPSIQAAINGAVSGDIIVIATGVYTENLTIAAKSLTLNGEGITSTVIDGNNLNRVVNIGRSTTVTMTNLTLRNGYANSDSMAGGGIQNRGTLILSDVRLENNEANSAGGAIHNSVGNIVLDRVEIISNTAYGGAGVNTIGGTAIISNTTFISNTDKGSGGGGLFHRDGPITIANSSFSENISPAQGGGIYHNSGVLKIINSSFSDNAAYEGGAVFSKQGSQIEVDSSFLISNTAANGGAIFNLGLSLQISGTTFKENTADYKGGAIYTNAGEVTLEKSLLTGNNSGTSGGGIYHYKENLIISATTLANNEATTSGGGLHIVDGILTVSNSTLSSNHAGEFGHNIADYRSILTITHATIVNTAISPTVSFHNYNSSITLSNTVLASNGGVDCLITGGTITGTGNWMSDQSCETINTVGRGDPLLGTLTISDTVWVHYPLDDTPLNGKATAPSCSQLDQLGIPRSINCDIGAIEFVGIPTTIKSTTQTTQAGITTVKSWLLITILFMGLTSIIIFSKKKTDYVE